MASCNFDTINMVISQDHSLYFTVEYVMLFTLTWTVFNIACTILSLRFPTRSLRSSFGTRFSDSDLLFFNIVAPLSGPLITRVDLTSLLSF